MAAHNYIPFKKEVLKLLKMHHKIPVKASINVYNNTVTPIPVAFLYS